MHERMIESPRRALEEQQTRLASVGEVCFSVAHGIRDPLAAISTSHRRALEFGTADGPTRLGLSDVVAESRRLDERVTRPLGFARGPDSAADVYGLPEAVAQAAYETQATARQQGVTCPGSSAGLAAAARETGGANDRIRVEASAAWPAWRRAPWNRTISPLY